ncbi:MAG: ArnT family glycosyltransferase [Vulcanimicrobiaceae bacterium]
MDVQTHALRWWSFGLFAIVLLAIGLRLHGIHNPILDHPNWRQGDTASIARNFARLNYNILYPQTNYDGPPPNYVELELQIVPFLAASLYKIFGVHAIFGRLISLAFSVATVAVVGLFGRWLFGSWIAGLIAAFFFAIFPGSVYYGRTFTPDTAMVFFLTAALYATSRLLLEDETLAPRPLARASALVVFAYLAKPVSVAGIVPILGLMWERLRSGKPTRPSALLVLLLVPLVILALYTQRVNAHAEWHWASGITTLHVIPALKTALTTGSGFLRKWSQFVTVLGMLRVTMLGSVAFALTIASFVALPWLTVRSKALLWGWLAGGLVYTYVVVTVERVDYYLYLLLPLCALVIGGALAGFIEAVRTIPMERPPKYAAAALVPLVALASLVKGQAAIAPYYHYSAATYRNAITLSKALDPQALVVMGHYGPDVLYYIDRYGWEEDPALWTPFDEESAIRKGARYFIAIENNRLRANADLCAWLQRFPRLQTTATWPVYVTDPAKELPGADAFWRAYRTASSRGEGRAFLNAQHRCAKTSAAPLRSLPTSR